MLSLGETLRGLREENKLPLRTVAAYLDIDQAILSKIERGQRKASRKQVVKLAEFLNVKDTDLLVAWLSDKLVYEVANEDVALKALKVAEEKVEFRKQGEVNITELKNTICDILKKDGRVTAAWLFGSVLTDKVNPDSDIDIIVELNDSKKYSMFDLLDIAYLIESTIKRRVDLVEKGQLKNFVIKTAKENLQKIYG